MEKLDSASLVKHFSKALEQDDTLQVNTLAKQFSDDEEALRLLADESAQSFLRLITILTNTLDKKNLDLIFDYFIKNKERIMENLNQNNYYILDVLLPCWMNAVFVNDQQLEDKYERYWDDNINLLEDGALSKFLTAEYHRPFYTTTSYTITNSVLKILINKYAEEFNTKLKSKLTNELMKDFIDAKQLDIVYLKYLSAYQVLDCDNLKLELNKALQDTLSNKLIAKHGKEDIKAIKSGLMQIYKQIIDKNNPNVFDFKDFTVLMKSPTAIASASKIGDVSLQELTLSQINNLNIKKLKQLFEALEAKNLCLSQRGKGIVAKAYVTFGSDRCNKLFTDQYGKFFFSDLEVFSEIKVQDYELDEKTGEPIYTKSQQNLMKFLFSSGTNCKDANIKRFLTSEEKDGTPRRYLNQFFKEERPSQDAITNKSLINLFNDWESINSYLSFSDKGINIKNVSALLQDITLALYPYQRELEEPLKLSNGKGLQSMIEAYHIMYCRIASTVPPVIGSIDDNRDYTYTILDLNSPLHLSVGIYTDTCFKFGCNGESSLIHACTQPNSRVFVVWHNEADTSQIIAQSWVWRDGTTLCFDNIEVAKGNSKHNDKILKAYQKAAEQIVEISQKNEEKKHAINLVTVGTGVSDLVPVGEELKVTFQPRPLGIPEVLSDAKIQIKLIEADNFSEENMKYGASHTGLYADLEVEPEQISLEKLEKDEKERIQTQVDKIIGFSAIADLKDPPKTKEDISQYSKLLLSHTWFIAYDEEKIIRSEIMVSTEFEQAAFKENLRLVEEKIKKATNSSSNTQGKARTKTQKPKPANKP